MIPSVLVLASLRLERADTMKHTTTSDDNARLQDELHALQIDLEAVAQRVKRVTQLSEAVDAASAQCTRLLVYSTPNNDNGLSRLAPLLMEMRVAVDGITNAHAGHVALQQRQERRLSIKVEQLADDQDHEGEQDAVALSDTSSEKSDDKSPRVVTPPTSNSSCGGEFIGLTWVDPLTARALECRRLAETITTNTDAITVFEMLTIIMLDVNREYTFSRSGKSRGSIPRDTVAALKAAIDVTMHALVSRKMKSTLVQSVLRLYKMTIVISHPKLQQLVTSSKEILRGLINEFPTSLCCMTRSPNEKSTAVDQVASDCFALAIDLLTTTDDSKHEMLIDETLHALKQSFRPVIIRPTKQSPSGEVSWGGRVLLLATRIVAYVIAKAAVLKADVFLKILCQIRSRHARFPRLLESICTLVREAPYKSRPSNPLDLPHEAQRIEALCGEK